MELTQSLLKELVDYDPETGDIVKIIPPARLFPTNRAYSTACAKLTGFPEIRLNSRGYVRVTLCGIHFYGHRLAMIYAHGDIPTGCIIDHVNGDKRDNRINNLRLYKQSSTVQSWR